MDTNSERSCSNCGNIGEDGSCIACDCRSYSDWEPKECERITAWKTKDGALFNSKSEADAHVRTMNLRRKFDRLVKDYCDTLDIHRESVVDLFIRCEKQITKIYNGWE